MILKVEMENALQSFVKHFHWATQVVHHLISAQPGPWIFPAFGKVLPSLWRDGDLAFGSNSRLHGFAGKILKQGNQG